jgi:hypothetical protein
MLTPPAGARNYPVRKVAEEEDIVGTVPRRSGRTVPGGRPPVRRTGRPSGPGQIPVALTRWARYVGVSFPCAA